MDWGPIAETLRRAAKDYEVFKDGAEAAREMVNAEHRLVNLQGEIREAETSLGKLHDAARQEQANVIQLRQDVERITMAIAPKRAELTELQGQYTCLTATVKDLSDRIVADRELAAAQVAKATRQQAEMEAEYHRVANEVTRLMAIRDELKASLARV